MFKFTMCDPLVKDVIKNGTIPQEEVLPAFRDFPWEEMLAKMRTAKEEDIYFSPSIAFTNTGDDHSLEISIVEDKKETIFYVFYKESVTDSDTSDLLDQSASSTTDILAEFSAGHYNRVRELFATTGGSEEREQKSWWKFW